MVERTLIDVAVRPTYGGGVRRVLAAYEAARDRVSILAGWELPEMVRRYAHLSPEHLREYVDKLAVPRVVDNDGTIPAQPEK